MTTKIKIHNKAHKDFSQQLLMKDIAELIGVRRSILANWASEFSMFIPTVKQGRKEYFRPRAVEVLRHIRNLKEEDNNKLEIVESLTKEFPIEIDKINKVKEQVTKTYNSKRNSKRKGGLDVVYLAMQSLCEVNERLDRLIQQVADANPENERLRELQSHGKNIDRQGERILTQSETLPQQHRGGIVIQRQSVERRDRDLLKELRRTIEAKEKLIKKQGFFARHLNR